MYIYIYIYIYIFETIVYEKYEDMLILHRLRIQAIFFNMLLSGG